MSFELGDFVQAHVRNNLEKEVAIFGIVSKIEDNFSTISIVEPKKHDLDVLSLTVENIKISKLETEGKFVFFVVSLFFVSTAKQLFFFDSVCFCFYF